MSTPEDPTPDFDYNEVDQTAQDPTQFQAPSVQWRNGNEAAENIGGLAFTGGFFFSDEQAGEELVIPNWERAVMIIKGGKKIPGAYAKHAAITIIRWRRRWTGQTERGQKIGCPWGQYKAFMNTNHGAKLGGHLQGIGFIKGYNDADGQPIPVCFTWKGTAGGKVLDAIGEQHNKLLSIVNRQRPKGAPLMPTYALWLRIQAGKHEYVGKENNKSPVTYPELYLPKKYDLAYCRELYIRREPLLFSQELYRELDAWKLSWDDFSQDDPSSTEDDFGHDDNQSPTPNKSAAAVAAQAPPAAVKKPLYESEPPSYPGSDDDIPF